MRNTSGDYLILKLWKRIREKNREEKYRKELQERSMLFKKYLNACECIQIDPSMIYNEDYIVDRANQGLQVYSDDESAIEEWDTNVMWIMDNYYGCLKLYSFDEYCEKLIRNGIIIIDIDEETLENKDITTNWLYRWENFIEEFGYNSF
ncbi:MAG: hypothetical protein FWF56_05570 [Firmicutes bacterium]|nr:hypothetical protein [Bacillota bacterium]MCL1953221.1 hypothetical protein [Bacillota bacterium]